MMLPSALNLWGTFTFFSICCIVMTVRSPGLYADASRWTSLGV
jgi:hypothetical protein